MEDYEHDVFVCKKQFQVLASDENEEEESYVTISVGEEWTISDYDSLDYDIVLEKEVAPNEYEWLGLNIETFDKTFTFKR